MAWSSIGAAVWFTLLQAAVIRRWCVYCLLTHALAATAAVLLLHAIGWRESLSAVVFAAAGLGCLILGQAALKPRLHKITSLDASPGKNEVATSVQPLTLTGSAPAAVIAPTTTDVHDRKHREVVLAAGRVKFDVADFPLLGSPDATHVLAVFLDFTCLECHRFHRLVRMAVEKHPERLAVAIIPIPLHEGCNPTVKCHRQEQASACNYARLAWRLWMDNPAAYSVWDDFLSEPAESQPYGLALLRAKDLAPLISFKTNESDAEADGMIATGIRMFQASTNSKVPALLLEQGILNGRVPDLKTLLTLMEPHLKLIQNVTGN
jgi:protein-disulfide isomerase